MSDNDTTIIVYLEQGPDHLRCLEYVQWTYEGVKVKDIAARWGVDEDTVRNRAHAWKQAGIMAKAMDVFLRPIAEKYAMLRIKVAEEMPDLINEALDIARTAKNPEVRLKAIAWLHTEFGARVLEHQALEDGTPMPVQRKSFDSTRVSLPPLKAGPV